MAEYEDDLDAYIAERAKTSPDLPLLVEAYTANRSLLAALKSRRMELGISQRALAERMATAPAVVGQIEVGDVDPRISTLQRLAVALGMTIKWELVPAEAAASTPSPQQSLDQSA